MKRVMDRTRPKRRLERCRWPAHRMLACAAALLLLGLDTDSSSAADASPTLWAGFESGAAPDWSVNQGIDVSSDYAHTGNYGAQATATPTKPPTSSGDTRAWCKASGTPASAAGSGSTPRVQA